ncbi:hypothetical protein [Flavobacterium yafengii]|uniref:hypothetical protein n=1 Tax=Flavobacterium yafengii TaxID=3041253 RepID=UPI0024A9C5E7|nr:hypothetical protein [Flavobacterium yafengii]MDI6045881.1 hypothetical protein [Flavobacterium yafengii]
MKKTILIFAITTSLISCQKNAEQIDVAKKQLQTWRKSEKEIGQYKFEVTEMMDKDMYDILYKKHIERSHEYQSYGSFSGAQKEMNLASKFIDSMGKAKGEKDFYRVHFYRMVGKDTVDKGSLMLNDKNKKIGFLTK